MPCILISLYSKLMLLHDKYNVIGNQKYKAIKYMMNLSTHSKKLHDAYSPVKFLWQHTEMFWHRCVKTFHPTNIFKDLFSFSVLQKYCILSLVKAEMSVISFF